MKYFPGVLCILFLVFSCEKYSPIQENYIKSNGTFIVCEGNYSYSTATLSFYDPTLKQESNDIFEKANGNPMGDVAQSMVILEMVDTSLNVFVLITIIFLELLITT